MQLLCIVLKSTNTLLRSNDDILCLRAVLLAEHFVLPKKVALQSLIISCTAQLTDGTYFVNHSTSSGLRYDIMI